MKLIRYDDAYGYGKGPKVVIAPENDQEVRFVKSLPGHWTFEDRNVPTFWIPKYDTVYRGDGRPPGREQLNQAWDELHDFLGEDPITWARKQGDPSHEAEAEEDHV